MGLVFGAFGEASEDVHELVQILAGSRLRAVGLQRGREGSAGEMAVIVGQIRRQLSVAAVSSQAECLLDRLHQVGPGVGQANRRRAWQKAEDARMDRDRRAHFLGRVRGTNVVRRGRFLLN